MQIFESYAKIPDAAKGAIIAIGNFDGVHRGHRALLAKASDIAKAEGRPLAVLTFEPHPRILFRPDDPPFRITPQSLKMERLEKAGVDIVFSLAFNWDFAGLSAEDFIRKVLQDGLAAAHLIIGYDFCFGQLRKGNTDTLKASGIPVTIIEKIDEGADKLSSSRIRQCLRHGKMEEANALLGWDWEIRGTVVRGDRRGRELGYPTANVMLGDAIHPAYGVYATWARIEGEEQWRPSATNIGIRPMFEIPTAQVETFIFDFDREIYDKTLHVKPVKRLRGEARFESLEELIRQMEKDCTAARGILTKG